MDRTLILVKPDAFARSLTGEIIARFERKGLRIAALQAHDDRPRTSPSSTTPSTTGKPFFGELVDVHHLRPARRDGARGPRGRRRPPARSSAPPTRSRPRTGSIRGDFALEVGQNMVHGSDSDESAAREAALFFPELG